MLQVRLRFLLRPDDLQASPNFPDQENRQRDTLRQARRDIQLNGDHERRHRRRRDHRQHQRGGALAAPVQLTAELVR